MFAILGSGFGLYGYLPALVQGCGQQSILLPERYQERFYSRIDIQSFTNIVNWQASENEILQMADSVVIAKNPEEQSYWINECLQHRNIEKLILEKPLAASPEQAEKLMILLKNSTKKFRINYSFRYTEWGKNLLNKYKNKTKSEMDILEINWTFLAHHYNNNLNNWKRFSSHGGGALRFYGIHIIALLAEIGYRQVISSRVTRIAPDSTEKWQGILTGKGLPKCKISIDTKSNSQNFSIHILSGGQKTTFFEENDPFDTFEPSDPSDPAPHLDRRIGILINLCQDLLENGEAFYPWYNNAIELWKNIELILGKEAPEYSHISIT